MIDTEAWLKEAQARCEKTPPYPDLEMYFVADTVEVGDFIAHSRTDLPRALMLIEEMREYLRTLPCPWCAEGVELDKTYCPQCNGCRDALAAFEAQQEAEAIRALKAGGEK
jgi:hypothetical protein